MVSCADASDILPLRSVSGGVLFVTGSFWQREDRIRMATTSQETEVWRGSPSQLRHLKLYLLCILILPIPFAIWRWLQNRNLVYRITTERLQITEGVFDRHTEELELYRVRDFSMTQPFLMRLFGLGNITLVTSDRSHPQVVLSAIKNPEEVREHLRTHVERMRQVKRVRELDVE